jgi:hypothetical protein
MLPLMLQMIRLRHIRTNQLIPSSLSTNRVRHYCYLSFYGLKTLSNEIFVCIKLAVSVFYYHIYKVKINCTYKYFGVFKIYISAQKKATVKEILVASDPDLKSALIKKNVRKRPDLDPQHLF